MVIMHDSYQTFSCILSIMVMHESMKEGLLWIRIFPVTRFFMR